MAGSLVGADPGGLGLGLGLGFGSDLRGSALKTMLLKVIPGPEEFQLFPIGFESDCQLFVR